MALSPCIRAVRHHGLMLAIELESPAKAYQTRCLEAGLIVTVAGVTSLRILPPLNLTSAQISEAIDILRNILIPQSISQKANG